MSVGKTPNEFCACCTLRYECNFHAGISGIFRTSAIPRFGTPFRHPQVRIPTRNESPKSKQAAQHGSTPGPADPRKATSPPTEHSSRQQIQILFAPVSSSETRYRRLCQQVLASARIKQQDWETCSYVKSHCKHKREWSKN